MERTVDLAATIAEGMPASAPLAAMASLGANRRRPANLERDLHTWVGAGKRLGLEPYWVKVWLQTKTRAGLELRDVPALLPHEALRAVCAAGPLERARSMLGGSGPDVLHDWWQNALRTEWAQRHDGAQALLREGTLHEAIPLLFHQDGVESFRDVEAQCLSFASAVSGGDTLESKFLFSFLFEETISDDNVRHELWKQLCMVIDWSLRICGAGECPQEGFYGEAFPVNSSRWRLRGSPCPRALFAGWKGDGESRKIEHSLDRSWATTYICEECNACQPFGDAPRQLLHTDFSDGAWWKKRSSGMRRTFGSARDRHRGRSSEASTCLSCTVT